MKSSRSGRLSPLFRRPFQNELGSRIFKTACEEVHFPRIRGCGWLGNSVTSRICKSLSGKISPTQHLSIGGSVIARQTVYRKPLGSSLNAQSLLLPKGGNPKTSLLQGQFVHRNSGRGRLSVRSRQTTAGPSSLHRSYGSMRTRLRSFLFEKEFLCPDSGKRMPRHPDDGFDHGRLDTAEPANLGHAKHAMS